MSSEQTKGKIRVGVVGLGFGGETHMKAYKQLPNVEVVALAGLEEDRLAYLGKAYEVPHLYKHYQDLLARTDLDAISIGVPNYLHAPVAIAALEAGRHVLCEKPLARTGEEAARMVQAAIKANRVLYTVFNQRAHSAVHVLKDYINEGKLGDLYYAKAYWMRRRGIPGAGTWFVNKEMSGGGPLIDLGVHMLDLALYLLGEPEVNTVSASTYDELGRQGQGVNVNDNKSGSGSAFEVEDLATAFLRLSTGATLCLETSWATHGGYSDDMGVVLYGTQAGAEIGVKSHNWTDSLHIFTDIAGAPSEIRPHVVGGKGHQEVVNGFIDAIVGGNWSAYTGREGLKRSRVIDACYASALQGREVVINNDVV